MKKPKELSKPIKSIIVKPLESTGSIEYLSFIKEVINARKDYEQTKEIETTKRVQIMSNLKARFEYIATNRDIIIYSLENEFKQRREIIDQLFLRIDRAMDEDKDQVVIAAVAAIEGIIKTSPLEAALNALSNSFEQKDGIIEI